MCVPYSSDETTGERVKTVELIVRRYSRDRVLSRPPVRKVDSRIRHPVAWRPRRSATTAAPRVARSAGHTTVRKVGFRIHFRETDLGQPVKFAGGRWDPERRLWLLGATRPSATVCFITWWPRDVVAGGGECGCWWVGACETNGTRTNATW